MPPSGPAVALQTEPAGMPGYVCDWTPVAPAGMSSVGDSACPLHDAVTVTGPCWPAAGPVMFLVTVSEPIGMGALL